MNNFERSQRLILEGRSQRLQYLKSSEGPLCKSGDLDQLRTFVEKLSEALRLVPNNADAYVERGLLKFFLGEEYLSDIRAAWRIGHLNPEQIGQCVSLFSGEERRYYIQSALQWPSVDRHLRDWLSLELAQSFLRELLYEDYVFVIEELCSRNQDLKDEAELELLQWSLIEGYLFIGENSKANLLAEDLVRSSRQSFVTPEQLRTVGRVLVNCRIQNNDLPGALGLIEHYGDNFESKDLKDVVRVLMGHELYRVDLTTVTNDLYRGVLQWHQGYAASARVSANSFIQSRNPKFKWELQKAREILSE